MKFRKNKRTEWWICKLFEGKWQEWDHTFKSEAAAKRMLRKDYLDEDHFAVVRIDMTMVARGNKPYSNNPFL